MRYKVYIDTWLISQTLLYYFALMLTAQLIRATISRLRLLVASVLGSIIGLVCFLPLPVYVPMGMRIPVVFLISGIVMLCLSFRVHGLKKNMKMLLVFFVVLLIMEGLCILSYSYFPFAGKDLFFICAILCFFYLMKGIIAVKRKREAIFYPVSLEYGEEESNGELTLVALIDTGNRLNFQGKGVCVIDPGMISEEMKKGKKEIGYVDYQGVNGQKGELPCYLFKGLVIFGEYGEEVFQDVYVAESGKLLSKEGKFQIILPPRNRL